MVQKFIQEIFINGDSGSNPNETVKKEYTKSELIDLLAPVVMVNLYYASHDPKHWMWCWMDSIQFEQWRKCPNFPQYEASDYGRIRNSKSKKILKQYETKYEDSLPKDIKQVIEEKPDTRKIGYLKVGKGQDVHKLVADAWLVKPNQDKLHIHHISNDGYDNSPYNLIYIPQSIHTGTNGIHSGLRGKIIPFYYTYPGPRKRII